MDQVTAISIFLIIMVLALPMFTQGMKRHPRLLRLSQFIILIVYIYANLRLTLIGRQAYPHRILKSPFWSYVLAFQGSRGLAEEIVLNILLYVPLGYLLHFTFPQIKAWQVILIGFLASALTESIQLVFKLGFCEFDDVLGNTLGTVIGVVSHYGMKRRHTQNG